MTKPQKLCFLIAAVLNFILFAVMNISSWNQSYAEFSAPSEIRFDHSGYSWGWPFDMYHSYTGYPSNDVVFGPGLIFNTLFFLVASSLIGLIFIVLFEKFSIISEAEKV